MQSLESKMSVEKSGEATRAQHMSICPNTLDRNWKDSAMIIEQHVTRSSSSAVHLLHNCDSCETINFRFEMKKCMFSIEIVNK
jgi:hypothetical protein